MKKISVLGEELWQCSAEEARRLWKEHPADRWRIWTEDEVAAHMMGTPEELAACIQAKKDKPGKLPVKGKPAADPADNPYWCATYSLACTNREECREDCCYQPRGGMRDDRV